MGEAHLFWEWEGKLAEGVEAITGLRFRALDLGTELGGCRAMGLGRFEEFCGKAWSYFFN